MAEIYLHGYGLLCERDYCVWHYGQWLLEPDACARACVARRTACAIATVESIVNDWRETEKSAPEN